MQSFERYISESSRHKKLLFLYILEILKIMPEFHKIFYSLKWTKVLFMVNASILVDKRSHKAAKIILS